MKLLILQDLHSDMLRRIAGGDGAWSHARLLGMGTDQG